MVTVSKSKSKELEQYDVVVAGITYRVSAGSRVRAVTEAIRLFREDYPESGLPAGLLRLSAQTSQVKPTIDRESLEELYSKARGESAEPERNRGNQR